MSPRKATRSMPLRGESPAGGEALRVETVYNEFPFRQRHKDRQDQRLRSLPRHSQLLRRCLIIVRQVAVMGAIVATIMYLPVIALLVIASFAVAGVSLETFFTFGGGVHAAAGLVLWWLIAFVPATVYAAIVMPH